MTAPRYPGFVDFVQNVLGVRLTVGQRVLARVAFDRIDPGRLDGEERQMAVRLFGPPDTIPPEARHVLAIVKGARIGGSYVFGALYSLWRALTADLSTLAPGEVAVALVVAPDLRLGRQVLRYAIGAAESVPSIARLVIAKTTDSIDLVRPDGRPVRIEVLPATRGGSAVRGRSLVSAVLSEASFFRDEAAAINDVDVFQAVNPRVLAGGMTVLESTPWTEAGLLFDLWTKNFGDPKTALAAHAPTLVMRPETRMVQLVEAETRRDPDNASREFEAQFVPGASGLFFSPDLLTVDEDEPVIMSRPLGESVAIGGDIGLVTDASAWCAMSLQGTWNSGPLTFCDAVEMRPKKDQPLKLSAVVAAGADFARRYGVTAATVDHHELAAAQEHLPRGFGLRPCKGGQDAKAERFLRVREAFRQRRISIPGPHRRLAAQLSLIVSKPKPGGGTQIVLPRRNGTHMDLASAFILAADALLQPSTRSNYEPELVVIPSRRDTNADHYYY